MRKIDTGSPGTDLADQIRNQEIRALFNDLMEKLPEIHPEVSREVSPVEARFTVRERCLCRVVPYRDLIHVQIGEEPCWEVRVRGEQDYREAFDRILRELLGLLSLSPSS